jgi:hypothetical protein
MTAISPGADQFTKEPKLMTSTVTSKPIISADSHIMEPPNTYLAHIDRKYKDTAPRVVWD